MLRVQTGKPSYMIKTTEIGINEFAVPPFDPIITLPKVQHIYVSIMCLKNTNILTY